MCNGKWLKDDNMLKKLNTNRKLSVFLYFCIFSVIFLCNVLTPYLVDDFAYSLSFSTEKPLESVQDIVPSLAAHAHTMNGRLTAHFCVQLFSLLPNIFFDFINAAVFCLVIWLISSYANEKCNNLLTAAVFCAIWLYQPAFGQVILWQDGSINYLWSIAIALAYIRPFTKMFEQGSFPIHNRLSVTIFLLFSFLTGSYSETVSAAAILVAFLFILLSAKRYNQKISRCAILSVAIAVIGYVSIYLAPAQWINKSTEPSLFKLVYNFGVATIRYARFGILAATAMVLLILNLSRNTSSKTMLTGAVFVAGSLAANYIMIAARTYPPRSTIGAFMFLLTALVIWLPPVIQDRQWGIVAISALAVLIMAAIPAGIEGVNAIATSYSQIKENEQLISERRNQGVMSVEVPILFSDSQYSALCGLKYLDPEDPYSWPNDSMAIYYGVETIIGVTESSSYIQP